MSVRIFVFETTGPQGHDFRFEIRANSLDPVDRQASFEIEARRTDPDSGDVVKVQASATVDYERGLVTIRVEDQLEFQISLDTPGIAEAEEKDLSGDETGPLWSAMEAAAGGDAPLASRLIDAIPVGDPFFGCLLRAGFSTFVGHIVKCAPHARQVGGAMIFARRLVSCLRRNGIRMLVHTALRTARCWMRAGAPDIHF